MSVIVKHSFRVSFSVTFIFLLWGCGQSVTTNQEPTRTTIEQPYDESAVTAEPAQTNSSYPISTTSPTEEYPPYPFETETVTEQPSKSNSDLILPPTLGIVFNKEFVITHVDPLGSAFPAGLQQGDRLFSVGGVQLQEDISKVKEMVFYANEGDIIEVVIFREGVEIKMEVKLFPIRRFSPPPPTPVAIPDDYL